jgi:DNA-binding NtrC family response regulator
VEDLSAVGTPHAAGRIIVGTLLARALEEIARAAAYSRTLVLHGESGTGKELGAREFHERGPHAKGPFVAVNCAAIPGGLAERLLFGTKRGAYSGAAADADGHLASAHGGVLFLDEVAELDLDAQAKLLRVLETGDVLPLGAQKAQQVDVRVCVATHRNLREEVTAGRFREDLYYRLAPPEVVLPPLRERGDEMVAHIVAEVASASGAVRIHPTLIEACLSRTWPGNVRELRKHVRQAAMSALAAKADRVRAGHLSDVAGLAIAQASQGEPAAAHSPTTTPPGGVTDKVEKTESESGKSGDSANAARKRSYTRWSASLTREQIEAALASNGGSMAAAARSLGMNRSQLYREMARHSIASGPDGSESA